VRSLALAVPWQHVAVALAKGVRGLNLGFGDRGLVLGLDLHTTDV